MYSMRSLTALLATIQLASAHIYMTYPGWRGDNLHTNGSVNEDDYKPDLFPYGMQWMYPCGGMRISENRTYWPVNGGALSFQPGWFPGHQTALIYVNMGLPDVYSDQLGYNIPMNYSHNMIKPFQITGPNNDNYTGQSVCLPQVPMPKGVTFHEGMNVTLQVVEAAQHGAALYNCVDLTLTNNMSLVREVTRDNCQNSSEISFQLQYSVAAITGTTSGAASLASASVWSGLSLLSLAASAWFAL